MWPAQADWPPTDHDIGDELQRKHQTKAPVHLLEKALSLAIRVIYVDLPRIKPQFYATSALYKELSVHQGMGDILNDTSITTR